MVFLCLQAAHQKFLAFFGLLIVDFNDFYVFENTFSVVQELLFVALRNKAVLGELVGFETGEPPKLVMV